MKSKLPVNNKVLLGLSGGVDSTAAALLLKEKGFQVTGLFFDVLGNQTSERSAAASAARELDIPFIYKSVEEEFCQHIITYFCEAYLKGETPNPCVMCNPTVKFRVMKEAADEIGAFYLATGHYAKTVYDEQEKLWYIERGASLKKDQSYMLYRLDQSVLSRLLLPLGEIEEKSETRRIVRELGIHNADQKDSQEICFIKEGTYVEYIQGCGYESEEGDFVDRDGRALGRHQGLLHYTVGQRKGLGITFGKPMFVIGLDPLKNQVVLGDNQDLFDYIVYANQIRLSCYASGVGPLPEEWNGKGITAKIRYAALPAPGKVYADGEDGLKIVFKQPQRAATPGQSVVFYEGNRLLGGGIITTKRQSGFCGEEE